MKIVHEELTALMGSGSSRLVFTGRPPTVILLAGLQGSGKTTAAAKLALLLRKDGKKPALVAADLQRPAAIDQLEQLGRQIQVPVYSDETERPGRGGRATASRARRPTAATRSSSTPPAACTSTRTLMDELARVRKEARPTTCCSCSTR